MADFSDFVSPDKADQKAFQSENSFESYHVYRRRPRRGETGL